MSLFRKSHKWLESHGVLILFYALKDCRNERSLSRRFQKIKNHSNRSSIKFCMDPQSWQKFKKKQKSLDFRHQNPRSEPKTVPNCKKSKKSTKVFLKVVLQFWWYKLEILYTKIKSNLTYWKKRNFFIFHFFHIFGGFSSENPLKTS